MSVREEDRQRNCPSRGFGIAAAAIGVGVGAALYYFFNKRSENPDASGSTSNWTSEEGEHALQDSYNEDSSTSMSDFHFSNDQIDTADDDQEESHITVTDTSETDTSIHLSEFNTSNVSAGSYITISEHSTTDTSMHLSESNTSNVSAGSYVTISEHSTNDPSVHDISDTHHMSVISVDDGETDMSHSERILDLSGVNWLQAALFDFDRPSPEPQLDNVVNFFERIVPSSSPVAPRQTRERSWTLEECSICFEGMQRNQEVMALPCTHRFHQPCILPWLQERQTCPNCRKDA